MRLISVVAALALVASFAVCGSCQNFFRQEELTSSDGAANDYFGSALAISSSASVVVVGAPQKASGSKSMQGAAYVYSCVNAYACVQGSELTAADGAPHDQFGISVAIASLAVVVIGAYQKEVAGNSNQGAAYVFSCTNASSCTQGSELTASDGASDDYFGTSVAVSGSLVVVGAYYKTFGARAGQGAAYVFTCSSASSCSQSSQLIASNGAEDDNFGWSVAISGPLVVVGAYLKTIQSNSMQGTAYVFSCVNASACVQGSQLTASNGAQGDQFGWSVAVSGSLLVIGANLKNVGANSAQGAAYVFSCFNASSCVQTFELTASDGAVADQFGWAVAMSGSLALVGASVKNIGANSFQGAAYVFSCANPYACTQGSALTAAYLYDMAKSMDSRTKTGDHSLVWIHLDFSATSDRFFFFLFASCRLAKVLRQKIFIA